MIVILEGAERTGKTTIAKMLRDHGFVYIKDDVRLYNGNVKSYNTNETNNRIDTAINYIERLAEIDEDVVVDRLHISNAVFANWYRDDEDTETYVKFYDSILSHLPNVKLCMFKREITDEYVKEHPVLSDKKALEKLTKDFLYYFDKSNIKNKILFDFKKDNPEYIVDYILEDYPFDDCEDEVNISGGLIKTRDPLPVIPNSPKKVHDFYLASPFFNEEQIERMKKVLNILRGNGYEVYAPFENGVVVPNDTAEFAKMIFDSNVKAIDESEMVLAITDGKDMGTIWEAGYAYGKGIPVVYYAETLGDNPFNIMLSGSGIGVYKDSETLEASAYLNNFTHKEVTKHE